MTSHPSGLGRPVARRRVLAASLLAIAALVRPLSAQAPAQAAPPQPAPDAPTIVIVTRHAEKAQDPGPDPSLDAAGARRARSLATALQDAGVSTVIVTQFRRTRQTAAPLAERLKVPVVERPVARDVEAYASALAQEIRASYAGRTVFVVGHSNTGPAIVAALSGKTVEPIPDGRYGDLYVVTMPRVGEPRLLRAKIDATPE
jgi:broad specificity phosphatase PhoE